MNLQQVLHFKGLRKILELKTTFIDRANTDERVYETAQDILHEINKTRLEKRQKLEENVARQVRPATETLTEKKLNLQGRVLRREFEHPLRQVTFRTANDATRATPLLIKEQGGQKVIDSPVLHRNHENMVKM